MLQEDLRKPYLFMVTPIPTAAPLPLVQVSASACTTVDDTRRSYNPSRQLMRMNSERALNSFM